MENLLLILNVQIRSKMNTPSEHNLDYLVSDNSITNLKERHSYYFQVQGQMGITVIKKTIFS